MFYFLKYSIKKIVELVFQKQLINWLGGGFFKFIQFCLYLQSSSKLFNQEAMTWNKKFVQYILDGFRHTSQALNKNPLLFRQI